MTTQPGIRERLLEIDYGRLIRFGIVGGLGTVVYYAALWLMVEKLSVGVLVATSIAFVLVVIENYVLHYHWTYVSSEAHVVALPKFVGISVVGFCINWTIMFVGVQLASNYLLVQAVAIAVVVAWNYVLNRWWIFVPVKA